MRKLVVLAALLVLGGCSGGGGAGSGGAPGSNPPPSMPGPPAGTLVTPKFTLVASSKTAATTKTLAGGRAPAFVSSGTLSITITLTSVGGSVPMVTPVAVTTNISGATCSVAVPCVVDGPPSPPGEADAYSITTFDAAGGTGDALDIGSTVFTPTAGIVNNVTITLLGIPFSVAISGVPANFSANTPAQSAGLTVAVADHAGQTITGTYANPVRVTDPDAQTTNGTHLSGTHAGSGCTNSCVDLQASSDTITLGYGGLAENPVTLTSSGTGIGSAGTATFTPLLQAIVFDNGTTSLLGGNGIDLFTTDSGSPVGFSGTEQYTELGFTNSPYLDSLAITGAAACSSFATLTTGANDPTHGTPFTATAIAAAVAGQCTITVTDNLTDQTHALPTFVVDYTTSSFSADGKPRRR